MDKEMTVRSKAVVMPGKARRILVKVLWVIVIIMIVSAVVGFITTGFQISVLLGLGVPAMIVSTFTKMPGSIPHYEFFLATIRFTDQEMLIQYHAQENKRVKNVCIAYTKICSVIYSKQLGCAKISFNCPVSGASNQIYHLLYMEEVSLEQFAKEISAHTDVPLLTVE